MAPLRVLAAVAAAACAVPALAQVEDTTDQDAKVWAVVAFVNHGEKTPAASTMENVLTPVGAQQMLKQGSAFRGRYLSGSSQGNSSDASGIYKAPIQGIETSSIDNSQLSIYSQSDEWVVGSAMAFLQGLYPPAKETFRSSAGGEDLQRNIPDGTDSDYPLSGYQYPKILSLTSSDPTSVVVQGTVGCTAWDEQMASNLTTREDMISFANTSHDFYQKLFSSEPLEGTMALEDANFFNAYDVYELVNYLYTHNETVNKGLDNANDTLASLQRYATELERAKTRKPVANGNDPLNTLYTVGGRTLAKHIADQLSNNILADAERNKLTLMFGSIRPLLSFFSVAGLLTREFTASGPLAHIPQPGAAMIVELIGKNEEGGIPAIDDLQVRFYYRVNADSDAELSLYPLFGSGFGGASVPYSSFRSRVEDFSTTPAEWCTVCKAAVSNSPWCTSSSNNKGSSDSSGTGESSSSSGPSSAVSGVIGAVVTAAVFGLVGLLLFLVFGFRVHRPNPRDRNGSLGGFKGAEKMASDPDLAMSKGGAAQERIGSWEMRDDGDGPSGGHVGIVTKDFIRPRTGEEDNISIMGAKPTRVHESV